MCAWGAHCTVVVMSTTIMLKDLHSSSKQRSGVSNSDGRESLVEGVEIGEDELNTVGTMVKSSTPQNLNTSRLLNQLRID